MWNFYKSLSEKKKGVVLIVFGLSLIALGGLGGPYLKAKLLEPTAQPARTAVEGMKISPELLAMDRAELKRYFRANPEVSEQVIFACSLEKEEFNKLPSKVVEVCQSAKRSNFFKPHTERASTFSSAGGLK